MVGERVCWKGEEAAIVIVLFGSTRAPLVWEEEKDVLCFVYDRVAKAATGNLWACRQAFSGCSAASLSDPLCYGAQHTIAVNGKTPNPYPFSTSKATNRFEERFTLGSLRVK